jgi:hypothetical protein
MIKHPLFFPMFFYIFYMFFLLLKNFKIRVKAIENGEISKTYFKLYTGSELPLEVDVMGRHLNNQFQLPLVFFVTCLTLLNLQVSPIVSTILASLFVLSRLFHSYIHLGSNHILHRAKVYALGWIFILLMWLFAFFEYVTT